MAAGGPKAAKGGGGHGEGRAAPPQQQQQQQEGQAYQQQLQDEVWQEVQQALQGFEGVVGQFEAAAGVAVDAHVSAFGAAGDYESVAWKMFAAARKKQQLGIAG
jgi:hypothetical protein